MERMEELVPQSVAKHNHKSKLEEAVFKATKSKPIAAKLKHERVILGETWTCRSSAHVFAELFHRPLGGKEVVVWKTLILVHKLMREGHPSCLDECANRKEIFDSLKAQYVGVQNIWGLLDYAYLEYLSLKISFHKEHRVVPGDINLNKFKENVTKFDPNKAILLVSGLLDLQKLLLSFQEKVLTSQGLDQCRLGAVVPCVLESYSIYLLIEYLLRKVQDTTDLDVTPIIDGFLKQFPVVQNFFFKASTIPYIRQFIPSPPLLDKPPTFNKTSAGNFKKPEKPEKSEEDKKKKKRDKSPLPQPQPQPQPFPVPQTLPANQQMLSVLSNPFQQPLLQQQQYQMQYLAQPQMVQPVHQNPYSFQPQTSKPPQQPQNQPKDAFSDLFTLGKQLNYTTSDNYADPFSALPSDAKVHYVRPDETRDALLNKITFLENRIKELEGEIRDIDGQNNELRLLLSEHDSGLSSVRAQMEERMKIQQQQFLEANTQLKAHVENTYKKYEKDKLALITEMVESDRKFVEQILLKFENPNNLGNRGATAEDILQSSKNLQSNYEGILKILETGGSFGSGLRNLVTLASKLTDDAKGALSKITDPNLKMQIATGCRNVIKDIAQILSNSLSIASQPQGKAEPRQLDYLKEEQAKFLHNLSSINNAVMNAQSVLRRDPYATNLESIAEQELHAAVKILTEIANGLRSQNANRSSQPGTTLDVGKTIGKASESILQSLSLLVSFAASAQSERLKQELTGVSTQDLHRDPMWTEALVNASKGVINGAKALVTATGNCTSTKLDSASLKEAAKIISASTSQLVAASRAKNNGQSQTNLDQASESVIRATNELVEAANTLANAEQIEIMANSNSFVDAVKEEIDSQSLILKTEKELNLARIRLNQLKQARDHPQLLNLPETTSSPFTSTPSNTPTLNQVTPQTPSPSNPTPVHVNPFL